MEYKVYKLSDETKHSWIVRMFRKLTYRKHLKLKFVTWEYEDGVRNFIVADNKTIALKETETISFSFHAYNVLLHKYDIILREKIVFENHTPTKLFTFN